MKKVLTALLVLLVAGCSQDQSGSVDKPTTSETAPKTEATITQPPAPTPELKEITVPVVSVAVVGPYRKGKSYLMNILAGKGSSSTGELGILRGIYFKTSFKI